MFEWDRLAPFTNIQIDQLQSSQMQLNISTYAQQIHGNFDYRMDTSFRGPPAGCKVISYNKNWLSWANNGFCVGPSLPHYYYCNHNMCYNPLTKWQTPKATVKFFTSFPMPKTLWKDQLSIILYDLTNLLKTSHMAYRGSNTRHLLMKPFAANEKLLSYRFMTLHMIDQGGYSTYSTALQTSLKQLFNYTLFPSPKTMRKWHCYTYNNKTRQE